MCVCVYIFIHMIKEKKRNDFHDMYTEKEGGMGAIISYVNSRLCTVGIYKKKS